MLKSIISHLPDSDKIVICDNYTETLQFIKHLDFMRPLNPLLYIGGSQSNNKKNIDLFFNNPEYRVLLTTRQKGGEGINLQIANHIVLLNCWYTVKDIIQIIGRIKRKGQTKPTYAYIFGNNLFNCIEQGLPKPAYVLKEDMDFYIMIRKKKMMCEQWGIHIETQFPSMKAFYNYETLEHDFNQFLEERESKESPKEIEYNGCNQDKKDEKQAFYDEEAETEDAYIDSLIIGYEEFYISQKNNSDFVLNELEVKSVRIISYDEFLKRLENKKIASQKVLPSPDMPQDVPKE